MNSQNNPMVSIRLMTFNHAAFIKDAMDGIMMQKTVFPVEVVVADDFSSDDTLNIIKGYADTVNIKINILERQKGDVYDQKRKQLGRLHNFQEGMEHCTGKYVALLDGDDYWTNPHKLQEQVDYLETHSETAISFHNVTLVDKNKKVLDTDFLKTKKIEFAKRDLVAGAVLPVCSVLMRNVIKFPSNFTKAKNGDTFLFALMAEHGKAHLDPKLNGFYRIHDGGVYSKKPLFVKKSQSLTTFLELKKVISPEFVAIVNRNLASNCWALTIHSKSILTRIRYAWQTLHYSYLYVLSKYLKLNV